MDITGIKTIRFVFLFLTIAYLNPAFAADGGGRFVVLGIGSESCGTYISERRLGRDNPYRGWITGYLSAYNESSKNTYNMLGNSDVEAAMLWIENYCNKNPLSSFSQASQALLTELFPNRQTKKP